MISRSLGKKTNLKRKADPGSITMESAKEFVSHLACGGGSSFIAKTCVAPFERIKIVLQTQVMSVSMSESRTNF